MIAGAFLLFAGLYSQSVCASYSPGDSYGHGDLRYHGPTAIPHVLHDGHIADTHEVAAAKAQHYAAVAEAKAHGGIGDAYGYGGANSYGSGYGYGGEASYNSEASSGFYGSHVDLRYHGPTAIPHVLHDGHIADTHEVAAAKSQHYAAVAEAKAHGGYGSGYGGQYAGGYSQYSGSYHRAPYHGPLAQPVVLQSGYLADTHEVAAARHHLHALHSNSHAHQDYH